MTAKIQAVNDHVIVEEMNNLEDKTAAGIFIPKNIKVEPQKYGKIISVGEEVKNVKEGQLIMFHQAGGQAITLNRTICRVLKNTEIYCILNNG